MEIMVNIPLNEWKEGTKVRQDVVQGICEAFLSKNCWNVFHPQSNGVYRPKTVYICRHKGEKNFYGFNGNPFEHEDNIRITAAEVKTAVKCLKKAGYFLHSVYSYGTWLGYTFDKYPNIENGHLSENISFTDDF